MLADPDRIYIRSAEVLPAATDATLLLPGEIWPSGKLPNPRTIFQGSSKTSAAIFAITGQNTTGNSEELRLVCGPLVGPSRIS